MKLMQILNLGYFSYSFFFGVDFRIVNTVTHCPQHSKFKSLLSHENDKYETSIFCHFV